jgi:hypothetical protein
VIRRCYPSIGAALRQPASECSLGPLHPTTTTEMIIGSYFTTDAVPLLIIGSISRALIHTRTIVNTPLEGNNYKMTADKHSRETINPIQENFTNWVTKQIFQYIYCRVLLSCNQST